MADEEKLTLWQRFRWWWTWRIWRPLRERCSWCDLELVEDSDPRAGDGEHYERGQYLGWGAWACQGCVEYPEG